MANETRIRRVILRIAPVLLALVSASAALAGGADYTDQDLTGRNFVGKDLEKATFDNAVLKGADFSNARCAGASFQGVDLNQTILRGGDFSGCDFRNARIGHPETWDADFSGANFEGVDLTTAYWGRVKFRKANLRKLKGIGTSEEVDFRGADLRGANLLKLVAIGPTPLKFRGAYYDRATKLPPGLDTDEAEMILVKGDELPKPPAVEPLPAGKDFRDQELNTRDFSGKDLDHASFRDSDLRQAKFVGGHAVGADFSGTDLVATLVKGADWSGADFRRAHFDWPDFEDVNLSGANFEGCNLTKCHWTKVNLTGANFRNSRGLGALNGSNLSGADLRGADLQRILIHQLDGALLKGAKYDKHTKWVEGANPEARGAVFVEK